MTVNQIYRQYRGRIRKLMNSIVKELREAGMHPSRAQYMGTCSDEHVWEIVVCPHATKCAPYPADANQDDIDIRFTILESEANDGSEGGMSFGIDVTSYGGRMLGGLTPYNYSDKVWVPRVNAAEVAERFNLFMQADIGGLVDLCKK